MGAEHEVRIIDGRSPDEQDRPFLPGAGQRWLLPFYDLFTRIAGVGALHRRAAEIAEVAPGETVLDVGCGTGNLSLAVLAAQPDAVVTGLDPDGSALRRAARKARRRGTGLTLVQGYASRLPAQDASLDHVVSSLALHHLDEESRPHFAREARRALRPGGRVTILDFDAREAADSQGGHEAHGHGPAHAVRHLSSLIHTRGPQHAAATGTPNDGIVTLLAEAGFTDAVEVASVHHRFGPVIIVQATCP